MKVLVIEDDAAVGRALCRALRKRSHEVLQTDDPEAGVECMLRHAPDVCLLDVQLSGEDGVQLLERARARGARTPILVVLAPDALPPPPLADDHLTRPLAVPQAIARLERLARLSSRSLRVGDLELDLSTRRARRAGEDVELTKKQFSLLAYLMQHAGEAVDRSAIRSAVFGYTFDPGTNAIDVHVSQLRKKLDRPERRSYIATVRGRGYRMDDQ